MGAHTGTIYIYININIASFNAKFNVDHDAVCVLCDHIPKRKHRSMGVPSSNGFGQPRWMNEFHGPSSPCYQIGIMHRPQFQLVLASRANKGHAQHAVHLYSPATGLHQRNYCLLYILMLYIKLFRHSHEKISLDKQPNQANTPSSVCVFSSSSASLFCLPSPASQIGSRQFSLSAKWQPQIAKQKRYLYLNRTGKRKKSADKNCLLPARRWNTLRASSWRTVMAKHENYTNEQEKRIANYDFIRKINF